MYAWDKDFSDSSVITFTFDLKSRSRPLHIIHSKAMLMWSKAKWRVYMLKKKELLPGQIWPWPANLLNINAHILTIGTMWIWTRLNNEERRYVLHNAVCPPSVPCPKIDTFRSGFQCCIWVCKGDCTSGMVLITKSTGNYYWIISETLLEPFDLISIPPFSNKRFTFTTYV